MLIINQDYSRGKKNKTPKEKNIADEILFLSDVDLTDMDAAIKDLKNIYEQANALNNTRCAACCSV